MTDRLHSFTLGDVARENARVLPEMEAIICGDHRLTYPAFDERVDRVATVLADHGIGVGSQLVWLGTNCHRLLEVIFAGAKLGAITTPVNWRLTAEETSAILEDLRPAAVFASSDPEFESVNSSARAIVSDGTPWFVYDEPAYDEALDAVDPVDPHLDTDDELPVLQIMTAAFGGRPKAAQLTSKGIVHQNVVLAAVGIVNPADDIYLGSGPMFHVGVLLKTFGILHWGGTNVIVPRVEVEEICRLIERERCTAAFMFAPTMRQIVELNESGRFDLRSLQDTLGGVPTEDIAEAWYKMTSCEPPVQQGAIGYGTSETVGMVTFEGRPPRGTGPFGRPSPVVALRILDADGIEQPPGEIGEIAVRGPQVMHGYLGEEPMDPDGWRHTGDLGRRESDGSITFLGPNQDMIKTGMENVYPVEVENALTSHPAVKAACVFGVEDDVWGQSVRAVVELESGDPSEDELIEHVRSKIASYKKPKSVVVVDELPRANGWVDRRAVKRAHGGIMVVD